MTSIGAPQCRHTKVGLTEPVAEWTAAGSAATTHLDDYAGRHLYRYLSSEHHADCRLAFCNRRVGQSDGPGIWWPRWLYQCLRRRSFVLEFRDSQRLHHFHRRQHDFPDLYYARASPRSCMVAGLGAWRSRGIRAKETRRLKKWTRTGEHRTHHDSNRIESVRAPRTLRSPTY
jgi:hypothetical protein